MPVTEMELVTVALFADPEGHVIGLRLATSKVRNKPAPNPPTVHYAFSTNGVTGSTSGIDLSP